VPATLYHVDEAGRAGVGTFTETLPAAGRRASVPGVGGTDALLASRLTAGDDLALAEAFDRFGRAVYGAALRACPRTPGDDVLAADMAATIRAAVRTLPEASAGWWSSPISKASATARSRSPREYRRAPRSPGCGWRWPSWKQCWTSS
jgi:hypothetical protein